ncbi:ethanolamine utilization protein EutN [Cereibacter sphaeroides]|uniref:Ethanolamine utilization protein EutN n=1 Tax=Cereibacter sphaeroides TaxID=1063 RepID=A0AAX1UIZ2_CERSP|nr:EutN/CcmL family microcompartment protein [Cereibacter sphaeroides]AZB66343.1 ethanolamine utilization protein EutN [Cereibacter sphaeroides]AZB71213.1 ethanolamine utilization protein EutN [Cereibacter sphaeroides]EGJ19309.1 ethanolamine utilization protein EutN [Cereibacter sphaeroides WS8N]MWP38485.1 ethanolamine utilization protein EutN [Cereibacter sphaeroides]RHZ93655.1 ethanolamine utilization protein EutN [Cereibacter sphaeroides]
MYLAKVIGRIVATTKDVSLSGAKLLLVSRLDARLEAQAWTEIAVDTVGAGDGETVIVTTGSAGRFAGTLDQSVVDASIVGIVDTVECHRMAEV